MGQNQSRLSHLETPCLILDEALMMDNIHRLQKRAQSLSVTLRPHLKTVKSVEVAHRVLAGGNGPSTVSTLREAEVFAKAGMKDILYAVGIAPQKLPLVLAIREMGCDLSILLDSEAQAEAVAAVSQSIDQGYGLICNEAGQLLPDLLLSSAKQEHGIVSLRMGTNGHLSEFPIGTRLRILPNHACATAAQHREYNVLPKDTAQPLMQ